MARENSKRLLVLVAAFFAHVGVMETEVDIAGFHIYYLSLRCGIPQLLSVFGPSRSSQWSAHSNRLVSLEMADSIFDTIKQWG